MNKGGRSDFSKLICVRNDHLDFVIPYEYLGLRHGYLPDFLVRLKQGLTLILEIKDTKITRIGPNIRRQGAGSAR